MKILLLNDDFPPESYGGAAVIVKRLAEMLAKNHQVLVLTTSKKKSSTSTHEGYQLKTLKIDYPSRWRWYRSLYNPAVNPQLKKILADFKPDVVNAHNIHSYLTYHSLKLAKAQGAIVIFTSHDVMPLFYNRLTKFIDTDNDSIPDTIDPHFRFFTTAWQTKTEFNPLRNPIIKHYLNTYTDHIVTVSQALHHLYLQNGYNHTTVINNCINIQDWQVSPLNLTKFRLKHHIPTSPTLFYGGRIRSDKGSLAAIKTLTFNSNIKLVVAGDDRGVTEMKDYARWLGVTNRIIFLGNIPIKDMKFVYHATTATIVPSLCFDSFPNNALEAMACAKPLILSKFAGTADMLEHKQHAYILNPFDDNQLKNAITFVFSQPTKPKQMGLNAQQLVDKTLNPQTWLNQYLSLFNS